MSPTAPADPQVLAPPAGVGTDHLVAARSLGSIVDLPGTAATGQLPVPWQRSPR